MELFTGKNKEQFGEWVTDNDNPLCWWAFEVSGDGLMFEDMYISKLPFEMQIGLYLAYYDSLGVSIDSYPLAAKEYRWGVANSKDLLNEIYDEGVAKNRNEGYKEAFKKANEIINS